MRPRYLVVGAGLSGLTIARCLHDAGKGVLVIEASGRPGGLVWTDTHMPSGRRYDTHGPHYLRTNSESVWRFLQRFTALRPWAAHVSTYVAGRLYPWPLDPDSLAEFGEIEPPRHTGDFESACLAKMPRAAYETFVAPYTRKQWGCPPRILPTALAGRIDQAVPGDRRLKTHRFQGLPVSGYDTMIWRMLDGIPIEFGHEFQLGDARPGQVVIYTGSLDDLFGHCFGRLPYRSQRRRLVWLDYEQQMFPTPQVNFPRPEEGPQVRVIEWRHIYPGGRGALLTFEEPQDGGREYPFPGAHLSEAYAKYAALAAEAGVIPAGRLGLGRYLDMDQAVAAGMCLARRLLAAD